MKTKFNKHLIVLMESGMVSKRTYLSKVINKELIDILYMEKDIPALLETRLDDALIVEDGSIIEPKSKNPKNLSWVNSYIEELNDDNIAIIQMILNVLDEVRYEVKYKDINKIICVLTEEDTRGNMFIDKKQNTLISMNELLSSVLNVDMEIMISELCEYDEERIANSMVKLDRFSMSKYNMKFKDFFDKSPLTALRVIDYEPINKYLDIVSQPTFIESSFTVVAEAFRIDMMYGRELIEGLDEAVSKFYKRLLDELESEKEKTVEEISNKIDNLGEYVKKLFAYYYVPSGDIDFAWTKINEGKMSQFEAKLEYFDLID